MVLYSKICIQCYVFLEYVSNVTWFWNTYPISRGFLEYAFNLTCFWNMYPMSRGFGIRVQSHVVLEYVSNATCVWMTYSMSRGFGIRIPYVDFHV